MLFEWSHTCYRTHNPVKGPLAELMVMVGTKLYQKYVPCANKGVPLMYVKLNNALYHGLFKSALLFYKKLVGDFVEYVFTVNPYDPCVDNVDLTGNQMTVCWHVGDLKVSHVNENELTKFEIYLVEIY